MLCALVLAQAASASSIIRDAWSQVSQAKTLSVTLVKTFEETGKSSTTKFWFKSGGYFRAESSSAIDVSNPTQGWTYSISRKVYQSRKPVPADLSTPQVLGLDILNKNFPILGGPTTVTWHNRHALKIELDGRKAMTKETKLFVFFNPKTHLPIGVSANLGSITQIRLYQDLQVNTDLQDDIFNFSPPKAWKQVTASTGGWN